MRVRSAYHHIARRDPALRADTFARCENRGAKYEERIYADQGHSLRAFTEHSSADLARIVKRAMLNLAVTSRLLHAYRRSDVGLREIRMKKPFGGLALVW